MKSYLPLKLAIAFVLFGNMMAALSGLQVPSLQKRSSSDTPRLDEYSGKIQTKSDGLSHMLGMINQAETLMKKRSRHYYRMNHLTRMEEPPPSYDHDVLSRRKRTSFWVSEYLLQRIKQLRDEIDEKKSLLQELDRLEDEARMPNHFYHL